MPQVGPQGKAGGLKSRLVRQTSCEDAGGQQRAKQEYGDTGNLDQMR
jgi:hypothetical protein